MNNYNEKSLSVELGLDRKIFTKNFINTKKIAAKSIHIIFFHDLFDYHGRYQNLISFFSKVPTTYNFSFIDLPGFGFSHSDNDFNSNEIQQAASLFVKSILKEKQESKVYLMGQGFGALIALSLMLESNQEIQNGISGAILSNPMLKIQPSGSHSVFRGGRVLGNELTTDITSANQFETDIFTRKKIKPSFVKMAQNLGYELRGQAYFIKKPVLFLLSSNDVLADSLFSKLFLKGIDKSIVTMREYPKEKHDLFNEKNRKEVFSSIQNWIV